MPYKHVYNGEFLLQLFLKQLLRFYVRVLILNNLLLKLHKLKTLIYYKNHE